MFFMWDFVEFTSGVICYLISIKEHISHSQKTFTSILKCANVDIDRLNKKSSRNLLKAEWTHKTRRNGGTVLHIMQKFAYFWNEIAFVFKIVKISRVAKKSSATWRPNLIISNQKMTLPFADQTKLKSRYNESFIRCWLASCYVSIWLKTKC